MKEEGHGSDVKRVEDFRFLKGNGSYVDDIRPTEGTGYLGLVRSPYAHAVIRKISFDKVKDDPELVAYLTGEDLKDKTNPISEIPRAKPSGRRHLATGKVRFVGEPVAAFVVHHKYAIEDIADRVEVEYDPLPVVQNLEESKGGKTIVYEAWGENASFRHAVGKGDPDSAFAAASHKIKARIGVRRQAGTAIEPRAIVASFEKDEGRYVIHASAQSAQGTRANVSRELRVPIEKVHVIVKDVGGGFGTKGAQSYPETLLCAYFAEKTGLTIRWTSTRTEDLLETASGRDEYCDIELACDSNGKLTGLRANIELDAGVSGTLSTFSEKTAGLLPGPYVIPNLDIQASCWATNKPPIGPVRGAGRPEATFFMERAVDIMARKIGMDPLEFRRRNIILPNKFPYENGAGLKYDSADFPLLIETLEKVSGYPRIKDELRTSLSKSENKLTGVGVCLEIEDTGAQLKENARIIASSDGRVQIYTGISPHGQGLETTLAQLASEELGVSIENISILYGDTDKVPVGIGTFGSRSLVTGGSAVLEACKKLKAMLIKKASDLLGVPQSQISIEKGAVIDNGSTKQLITFSSLLRGIGENLEVSSEYNLSGVPYASGAHLCALSIDADTGKVTIHRYVAVDDCGYVVNHMIVEGQIHGGIVHGIGGSLFEELLFDSEGQPLTSNFLNYLIPSAPDIPERIDFASVVTPSPVTPNGAKGVGESGTIAAYPAIFNALNDALAKVGAEINLAPATPEAISKAIKR